MQINLLQAMNYPLISEYVEAIKMAEDNFEELSYLRPVLDDMGQPVMSSGNFAVVFKMRDERDGKLYAVRCFHRDQEGRTESYRLIEEELKDVESPYLVSFRYIDKELFVDSSQTDETEFPVLLMDWVEGITLDKYLRENIDDQYALEMLAYRFSQLAQWQIPQPFAHGDLKPDNILVREDGTLVLVDYDGMYVPAMKGQKARELGSPDFRHPLRTEDDFDEHIDDFPFVSVLLSLKAISLNPQLLEEYGATDRLLFSEKDYRDIANSAVLRCVLNQMANVEIARIYSLFIIVLSEKVISENSYRLVFAKEEKNKYFEIYKNQSRFDSESKYCYSCLLMNGWGCKQDINKGIDLIAELAEQGHAQAQFKLGRYYEIGEGVNQDYKKAIIWYTKAAEQGYGKAQNNLGSLYMQGQGIPQNYQKAVEWLSKAAEQGLTPTQYRLGCLYIQGVGMEKNYEKAVEWFAKAAEQEHALAQGYLGYCYTIGKGIEQNYEKAVEWLTKSAEKGFAQAQYSLGLLYMQGQGVPQSIERANEWLIKAAEQGHVDAQKKLKQVTKDDRMNQWVDKDGVAHSADGKRLLIRLLGWRIEKYIINNNVRIICNSAFQDSTDLIDITIPDSVICIGEQAFRGCEGLNSVFIPNSVINIEDDAFQGCYNLESLIVDIHNPKYDSRDNCNAIIETQSNTLIVGCQNTVIPNGVTNIGKNAFSSNTLLSNITIPNSITHIPDGTFNGCDGLESVTILKGVKSIGKEAFLGCLNLSNIFIPDSITTIGEHAFKGCNKLTDVIIPCSVANIGEGAFAGDDFVYENNIERIIVDIHNPIYDSRDNCNAIIETQSNTLIVGCQNTVIPNNVVAIGKDAFQGCIELTSITIPHGIASIPDKAFWYCIGLTKVSILNGVKSIGKESFYHCVNLKNIVIPNSITDIGESAFSGCRELTHITIPRNVKNIGNRVFAGISDSSWQCGNNLQSIIVDEGNNIYDSRDNCNAIIETNSNTLIAGCQNTIIPNGVQCIGESAFFYCKNLITIKFPESVTEIMDCAFSGCESLKTIILPNSITHIGKDVFHGCYNLNIYIPAGTRNKYEELLSNNNNELVEIDLDTKCTEEDTTISWNCDNGACYSIDELKLLRFGTYHNTGIYTIKEGTLVICDLAFNNFENDNHFLKGVHIPSSVVSIGKNPFAGCIDFTIVCDSPLFKLEKGLLYDCFFNRVISNVNLNEKSIEIHSRVISIGAYSFSFSRATSLKLPDLLNIIEEFAFACSDIECITIPPNVSRIEEKAFMSCSDLTDVLISGVNTEIAKNAFDDCTGIQHVYVPQDRVDYYKNRFPDMANKVIGIGNYDDAHTGKDQFAEDIYKIGKAYWNGDNVAKDYNEAIRLYCLAAQLGHQEAQKESNEWQHYWFDKNIAIYSKDRKTIMGLRSYYTKDYQILDGTENIVDNAFLDLGSEIDYSYLDKIVIPKSIIQIGHSPFNKYLSEIVCHSPYFEIDNNTLYSKGKHRLIQCYASNKEFIIPDGVEYIDDHAFYGCKSQKIIIPASVTKIGINPFIEMDMENGLLEVESMSSKFFVRNNSLYENNMKLISYWGKDESFTVPDGIIEIGEYAFFASDLKTINLPQSINFIGDCAFGWCFSLKHVLAPAKSADKFRKIMDEYKDMIRIAE